MRGPCLGGGRGAARRLLSMPAFSPRHLQRGPGVGVSMSVRTGRSVYVRVTVRPRCGPHCQIVQLAWPRGGGSGALMLGDSQGPLGEEGNPHSLLSRASWGMGPGNPEGDLGISVPTLTEKVPPLPQPPASLRGVDAQGCGHRGTLDEWEQTLPPSCRIGGREFFQHLLPGFLRDLAILRAPRGLPAPHPQL